MVMYHCWTDPKLSSKFSFNSLLCVSNPLHPLHTNQRLSSPVILVVKDVSVSVKEVRKEFPQIVVVRLLKEVQSTHVPQVGGHLFCFVHTGTQTHFTHTHTQRTNTCTDSYTETHTKFDQHMLAWAYMQELHRNTAFFCRGVCVCVSTNLGSFHRGPLLVCLSWCLLSSDNVLSECQPNEERGSYS